jgi:hydroxymethylpyrimidine/phosphomethylpyrimidine kinase
MAAITALTAQNTKKVSGVYELPAAFVAQQVEAIFKDIRVDAVKIGMAGNPETIAVIAKILKGKKIPIVLDPVMVAQSGDRLISGKAVAAMKKHLIPLATVLTPNIPEAAVLARNPTPENLLKLGSKSVLIKGGHGGGASSDDIYADAKKIIILKAQRVKTKNNHGTGCALSSAIACYLAQGMSSLEACRAAKKYLTGALRASSKLSVGRGHGPVHQFYELWG